MLVSQIALRYAQAIFELADAKKELDAVEMQLAMVEATLADSRELSILMYQPSVPMVAKKEIINQIFGDSLADYVRNFLFLLIDKRRESALPGIIKEYRSLANQARNIAEAEVTTAFPMSEAEHQALVAKLSGITGKNIRLKTRIDNRILGGLVIRIGDKLIDGSVKRQIESMKSALLAAEVTKIGVTY